MDIVIAVTTLLFVLFMAVGAYATVKVVGAAKRGVDRTLTQARRKVEDTTLRAKSLTQAGPVAELAQLRLHLRMSMRATQDALHAKVAEDESLKESLALFQRLSVHGHELDDELKRLESEPDRFALATRLPELRTRTRQITQSAESLRWAARERAHRFAGDDLETLSAQIDMEAGALRHWEDEPETSPRRRPEPRPETPAQAGSAAGEPGDGEGPAMSDTWPGPAASGHATSAEQTWPDPAAAPRDAGAQDASRPAITPPVRPPTYSWQKQHRPENTT